MKLHVCCGDVYLKDYINIDIDGTYPTGDYNPNLTTIDEYYKQKFDKNIRQRPIIVDKKMDITQPWDFEDNSVNEILMICSIEHFTPEQARHIFKEVYRVLIPGGIFAFDFPDLKRTVLDFEDDPELMMRLIYCTYKNEHSIHKYGYTRSLIMKFLGDKWQRFIFGDVVKHDFPTQGVTAIK